MIKIETPLGMIEISGEYFSNLVGHAASECFGVAGMALSGPAQGFKSFMSRRDDQPDMGVKLTCQDNNLTIDLHIIVTFGVNISEIVKSIVHKVKYVVEEATGLSVYKVNVFVDGMKTE